MTAPGNEQRSFDEALDAARADRPWGYRWLFERYGGRVAGYLRSQGADDPDGLANEVFYSAFRSLGRFRGDERAFRSWLFSIAHNRLVDDRRRRGRRPGVTGRADENDLDLAVGAEPGADHDAMDRMSAERVRRLLEALSTDQRDALLLRIFADLSLEQTAAAMDKSTGAVKQLQRRGLAALRRLLKNEGVTL